MIEEMPAVLPVAKSVRIVEIVFRIDVVYVGRYGSLDSDFLEAANLSIIGFDFSWSSCSARVLAKVYLGTVDVLEVSALLAVNIFSFGYISCRGKDAYI